MAEPAGSNGAAPETRNAPTPTTLLRVSAGQARRKEGAAAAGPRPTAHADRRDTPSEERARALWGCWLLCDGFCCVGFCCGRLYPPTAWTQRARYRASTPRALVCWVLAFRAGLLELGFRCFGVWNVGVLLWCALPTDRMDTASEVSSEHPLLLCVTIYYLG